MTYDLFQLFGKLSTQYWLYSTVVEEGLANSNNYHGGITLHWLERGREIEMREMENGAEKESEAKHFYSGGKH